MGSGITSLGLGSTGPEAPAPARGGAIAKAAGGVLGGGGLTVWLVMQFIGLSNSDASQKTALAALTQQVKRLERENRMLRDHVIGMAAAFRYRLGEIEPPQEIIDEVAAEAEAAAPAAPQEPAPSN